MADPDLTPEALKRLCERLQMAAKARADVLAQMARDKTLRNRASGEHDALYAGVPVEDSDEWQAAAAISGLMAEQARLQGALEFMRTERDDWQRIHSELCVKKLYPLTDKLRQIAEIASNTDKRGWSDFDRIATIAHSTSQGGEG